MDKRLKEIVIYILENSSGLEPEQRAELEELHDELDRRGFSIGEIERAVRRVLESEPEGGSLRAFSKLLDAEVQEVELSPAAAEYLRRTVRLGLISEDQEDEVLIRAARLYAAGVELADMQFLVASLLFDEKLGVGMGRDGSGERGEPRWQH